MVFRAYRNGDRGKTISITRFRRDLHRILREIPSRPAIVTVDGWVEYWVGVLGERPAAQRPTPDPWPGEHR
jgi:hypothetical protein